MSLETWLLYAAAVLVLTATPGPTVLMCVNSSVNHGARRTLFCALGSVTAVLGIMACSALGVGAVLAASEKLFHGVKWVGVAYLLYVGIGMLRAPAASFDLPAQGAKSTAPARRTALYLKGFFVGASNPKALLFFTAFFPQFIDPAAPQLAQFMVLGGTFAAFEIFWLMFYAGFAARLAPWLRVQGRAVLFNRASGAVFIAAAALLATAKRVGKEA